MFSSGLIFVGCLLSIATAQLLRANSPIHPHLAYQFPSGPGYTAPAPIVRNVPLASPASLPVRAAPRTAAILSQSQDVNFDGTYTYGFQSEDGTSVQARGVPSVAVSPEGPGQAATGSFSYLAPDGTPITTNWYADETGFHAEGAHLPKAPEGHYRTI